MGVLVIQRHGLRNFNLAASTPSEPFQVSLCKRHASLEQDERDDSAMIQKQTLIDGILQ